MVSDFAKQHAPHATYFPYLLYQRFSSAIIDSIISSATKIINCSFGNIGSGTIFSNDSTGLSIEVSSFAQLGTIVVLAAGNESLLLGAKNFSKKEIQTYNEINKDKQMPGAVLMVGASEEGETSLASYSNMAGSAKDFYIYAELNATDHKGTSFTAPQVSAALARLQTIFPHYTSKQLVKLLLATAECPNHIDNSDITNLYKVTNITLAQLGKLRPEDIYGRGKINIGKAIHLGLTESIDDITLRPLDHENDEMLERLMPNPLYLLSISPFSKVYYWWAQSFLKTYAEHLEFFMGRGGIDSKVRVFYMLQNEGSLMQIAEHLYKESQKDGFELKPCDRSFIEFIRKYNFKNKPEVQESLEKLIET